MGPRRARHPRRRSPTTTSRTPPSPSAASAASPIAGAPVIALRVTYVGELGWELHIPVEFAATVYDALTAAGAHGSPTPATAPSSRCAWKRAIAPGAPRSAPTTRRSMAGLGFAVKLRTNIALPRPRGPRSPARAARSRASSPASPSPTRTSCCSAARRSTATASRVGWLASGGWGYTVGANIGYGYVRDPENGVDRRGRPLRQLRARGRHRARAGAGLPEAALRSRIRADSRLSDQGE